MSSSSDPTKQDLPPTTPATQDTTDARVSTTLPGGGWPDSSPPSGAARTPTLGPRYEPADELLGEGGMGAVWCVGDRLIGRRVALKVLRAEAAGSPALRAMFMREARVQGQLEHPAIVPVYDAGLDAGGAAYFTMKRVRGKTLAAALEEIRLRRAPHAPRRLLGAFASVCLAVDFAHQHGVIHRDLKPSNLMLGDYGEVNVLDWGVARVLRDESSPGEALKLPTPGSVPTVGEQVRTRAVGTAGYMAPEQAHGIAVGPAADVYALGTILYEILTLRPLYTVDRSVAPVPEGALTAELAAICARATADDPGDRYPTARALHQEIEAYLDGERSADLRRRMAAGHLQQARALIADGAAPARKDALRAIGRALALEPDDPDALRTLYQLFAEPPIEPPAEVTAEIAQQQVAQRGLTARTSAAGYASIFLFLPFLLWMGVRSWPLVAALFAAVVIAAVFSWYGARRPGRPGTRGLVIAATSTLAFALGSTMFGPLVLVPTMIATNTMALALHMDRRARAWAIAIGIVGVIAPIALAALHLVPASYAFGPEGMIIRPLMLELPAVPTLVFLAFASAVTVYTGTRSAGEVRDALAVAEQRLYTQRWQLRQLLPEGAPSGG